MLRKKISAHPDPSFAIFTAFTAYLSYAVFINQLGLYGDDANFLWAYHRGGASEYKLFFSWNREVGYLFYKYLSPILGENVLAWHVFCTAMRWLSSFLIYKILKKSFPAQNLLAAWTSVFFLLYPGFLQQSVAVEFSHHFVTLAFLLGSFILTQYLVAGKGIFWILFPVSLLFEFLGLFLIEYFVGLEFFRPVIIWTILCQLNDQKHKLKRLIRWELPYAAILLFFIIWRAFFSKSGYIQPNVIQGLSENPFSYIVELIGRILSNLKTAGVDAWLLMFKFPNGQKTIILYLIIVLISFSLFYCYAHSVKREENNWNDSDKRTWQFFFIGLFIFLVSGLPVWAAGLQMELSLFWDRITLSFIFGASMMLAALFSLFFRKKYQSVIIAVLVGIMAGYQFQVQNQFRKDWLLIQNYFWQLQWRAPDIEPNTIVLGDQFPFETITDNSLNALLNWNYENPDIPADEAYKFFQITARLGFLNDFSAGNAVSHNNFRGNTSDSLVIYATPSTCLKVLTEEDINLPFLNSAMKKSLHLSNPSRVIAAPSREIKFEEFMGNEPAHNWCYYYEKGELSAQQGKWDETLSFGKEAFSLGYSPSTAIEMKNFVFSALIENDLETADLWINRIITEEGNELYFQKPIVSFKEETELSSEAENLLEKLQIYSTKIALY